MWLVTIYLGTWGLALRSTSPVILWSSQLRVVTQLDENYQIEHLQYGRNPLALSDTLRAGFFNLVSFSVIFVPL